MKLPLIFFFFFCRNDDLQSYFEKLSKKNPWLQLTRYEYANIIQGGPFIDYFNQYYQLLDILWWKNLRVANWRHFMHALEQHTTIYNYMIYIGTLDVVQVPVWSNPGEFEYLEVQVSKCPFFNFKMYWMIFFSVRIRMVSWIIHCLSTYGRI